MPTTRGQKRAIDRRRLLLDLPTEIDFLIYEFLTGSHSARRLHVFRPDKIRECCSLCHNGTEPADEAGQWTPWTLTQVSSKTDRKWRPIYHKYTRHKVCLPQLSEYATTFWAARNLPSGPPAHNVFVTMTPETVAKVSLHVVYEAQALIPTLEVRHPVYQWDRKQAKMWSRVIDALTSLESLEELLPGAKGAGKMEGLFLDKDRNLRLDLAPKYLSEFPALDADIRNVLFELWKSARIGFIHLRLLPREGQSENYDCVDLKKVVWTRHPHKSFICSVHRFYVPYGPYGTCTGPDYTVIPSPFVLPEGHSLMEIGVNRHELRRRTDAAVYLQLVARSAEDFPIRVKTPPFPKDFTMPGSETGSDESSKVREYL